MLSRLSILLFTLSLATFGSLSASAQGDTRTDPEPERFFILIQGYRAGALSGSGLSSSFGVQVADIGSANPAALGAFGEAVAGLSYRVETAIGEGYLAGIGYGPRNSVRPQSASVAVPVGAFTLGLSYAQRYAAEMQFEPIPTPPEIDPTLEFEASFASRLETISPQAAYRTTLKGGGVLAIGLRLGIGYASFERTVDNLSAAFSGWGTQLAGGLTFRTEKVGWAVYGESALRVEGEYDQVIASPPGDDSPDRVQSLPTADALPPRIGVSAEVAARQTLDLGIDAAWSFWTEAWDESGQDSGEVAAWGRLHLANDRTVSFGVLWQDRNRWGEVFNEVFDYSGRAIYLTLGGALTLDRFRLNAVVADSRLLSGAEQRQTVVKLGASVQL
ncbi:MAG: hypothetical protein AAGI91_03035 [Bacteroidota bacterium]